MNNKSPSDKTDTLRERLDQLSVEELRAIANFNQNHVVKGGEITGAFRFVDGEVVGVSLRRANG